MLQVPVKLRPLLTLGEPEATDWPDYVAAYQLTAAELPDLLAIYTDEELALLPPERHEAWASIHAWRALGQLGDARAAEPIVAHFDALSADDYALNELSRVMALLGPPAIPALARHFQTWLPERNEFSYAIAIDGLTQIALAHPAQRAEVLQLFHNYLLAPLQSARTLNSMLLGNLLDLNAVELIDDIRRLFARNCVDLKMAGDLEEIEIALSLRTERSTPKPKRWTEAEAVALAQARNSANTADDTDYVSASARDNVDEAANEPDIYELIADYFHRYGGETAMLNASELDGFFAALGCAPTTITPSTWMPALWGGADAIPEWQNENDVREFTTAVFAVYNQVMQDLQDDDYDPLFLEVDTEDGGVMTVADDWCEGFVYGLSQWGNLPKADIEALAELIKPVYFFIEENADDELSMLDDIAEATKAMGCLAPMVRDIHRHFFRRVKPANTTVIHATPKSGRNDPCPCGSGKKYKKCCGLN